MEIIILITALVLAVSLYDFFTSRNWQQVTSSSRNEVVFDDRNKEYGAYQIRKDYDRSLIFILLGIAGTVGIVYSALFLFGAKTSDDAKLPPPDYLVTTIELPPIEIDNTIVPPQPVKREHSNHPVDTKQFVELTVTDNNTSNKPPIQDGLENTQVGKETIIGSGDKFIPPPIETEQHISIVKEIEEFPEIEAMFPGGTKAMMAYLSKNIKYPEIALQTGAQGKVILRFVVGKDGRIENVTVAKGVPGCPECDKEAIRVVKSMPQWTPAESKGKMVKSYFNLPVTFQIKR